MAVIEETRKLIQDFLAPELRAIAARLDALEQRESDHYTQLQTSLRDVLDEVKALRHDLSLSRDVAQLKERMARIESAKQ